MNTHTNTQGGFAVGIAVGIIALLALIGGTAYVATQTDADINIGGNATTSDDRRGIFGIGGDVDIDADADSALNTQFENSANVDANADAKLNVDLNSILNTTTKTSAQATTHTIAYTDTGFSPSVLTIKSGDTVEFMNKSSGEMWVASAIHPFHLKLPEFDQNTSVGLNGTYSFTFTKLGEWKFHNHLKSSQTGTIIVR